MRLPDQETIFDSLPRLAAEAGPTSVPSPGAPGAGTPIYLGNPHETIPERYVIHFTTHRCESCSRQWRDDSFFALTYLRSRIGGTRIRHLIPCSRPEYNLPVDLISVGARSVPFCSECPTISLAHLPPPPSPAQVYDLPDAAPRGAKRATEPRAKPAPAPRTRGASLDELI